MLSFASLCLYKGWFCFMKAFRGMYVYVYTPPMVGIRNMAIRNEILKSGSPNLISLTFSLKINEKLSIWLAQHISYCLGGGCKHNFAGNRVIDTMSIDTILIVSLGE